VPIPKLPFKSILAFSVPFEDNVNTLPLKPPTLAIPVSQDKNPLAADAPQFMIASPFKINLL